MEPDEARHALDAMQGVKDRLARTVSPCPPWRHGLIGLAGGFLVLSVAAPGLIFLAIYLPSMALMLWILNDDRKRYGIFVDGWRRGRTLPVSLALLAIMLVLLCISFLSKVEPFPGPTALLAAGAAFVATVVSSIVWQRTYRAELTWRELP